jgi:hypothetical protein
MAFDPTQIKQIQLGRADYPEGEAVLGKYGWHVLELILDDEGNWTNKVFQSNQMNATVEELIKGLSKNYYLAFELDAELLEFKSFLVQFGKPGSPELSGSFNGDDFEELVDENK